MRTARRVTFAAPLVVVVVACQRPAPQHPERDEEDEDEDEERGSPVVVSAPPVDAAPDAWLAPKQLVDELKPLTSDRTIEDVCRHARCNPPPPYKPSKPYPVETKTVHVNSMMREGTGTRVRLWRPDHRSDAAWRAVFVNDAGEELPNGECTIVAWDFHELECTTALTPEQLTTPRGWREPFKAKVIPPQELVERVERQRANWIEPISSTSAGTARVIGVSIGAAGTEVIIAVGADSGVTKSFSVSFGNGDRKFLNGECKIVSVNARTTKCTTMLTPDQVKQNDRVTVTPPK